MAQVDLRTVVFQHVTHTKKEKLETRGTPKSFSDVHCSS